MSGPDTYLYEKAAQIESRLDTLTARLSQLENDLDHNISDVRSDLERSIEGVRSDLSTLEHKVNYS